MKVVPIVSPSYGEDATLPSPVEAPSHNECPSSEKLQMTIMMPQAPGSVLCLYLVQSCYYNTIMVLSMFFEQEYYGMGQVLSQYIGLGQMLAEF